MRHVSVVTALAIAVPGQTQIWRVIGTQLNNQFGGFLAPLRSDLDSDGVADVLVTSRNFLGTGGNWTHLLSGRTGSILRTDQQLTPFESMVAGEDVDGDGIGDYLVGGGGLRVFTGSGLLIRSHPDPLSWGLGAAARFVGDLDDDGYPDYAHASSWGANNGTLIVHSGRTGSVIHYYTGGAAGGWLWNIGDASALGDLDQDGWDDFGVLVGRRLWPSPAVPYLFAVSGQTGALIRTFSSPPTSSSYFGVTVTGGHDIDNDGVPDVLVSDREASQPSPPLNVCGALFVYSGATGALVHTIYGDHTNSWFSDPVSFLPDLDRDGFPEVLVGVRRLSVTVGNPFSQEGAFRVYSGRTWTPLWAITGAYPGVRLGGPLAAMDLNGDHVTDIVANSSEANGLLTNAGAVYAYSLPAGLGTAYSERFGAPCPASDGRLPRTLLHVAPRIGIPARFQLRSAPRATAALLVIGDDLPIPLVGYGAPGCIMHALPQVVLMIGTDAVGRASCTLPIPNDPAAIGLPFACTWLVAEPSANTLGLVAADAHRFWIGS